MLYVIVKNAAPDVWKLYWDDDPQKGVHPSHSAYDTYTGIQCNIQKCYATRAKAQEDCNHMNNMNPTGHYAVCPVEQ